MGADIDVVTATARELKHLLAEGKTTSRDLVEAYLSQINLHNHKGLDLRAIRMLLHDRLSTTWPTP